MLISNITIYSRIACSSKTIWKFDLRITAKKIGNLAGLHYTIRFFVNMHRPLYDTIFGCRSNRFGVIENQRNFTSDLENEDRQSGWSWAAQCPLSTFKLMPKITFLYSEILETLQKDLNSVRLTLKTKGEGCRQFGSRSNVLSFLSSCKHTPIMTLLGVAVVARFTFKMKVKVFEDFFSDVWQPNAICRYANTGPKLRF